MQITQMDRSRWQRDLPERYEQSKKSNWSVSAEACVCNARCSVHLGELRVLRSFAVKTANLKGLCHGDDFCGVARRKQVQIFGNVLEKRFKVTQTVHTRFSARDAKKLNILNRTMKMDVHIDEMTWDADTQLDEYAR